MSKHKANKQWKYWEILVGAKKHLHTASFKGTPGVQKYDYICFCIDEFTYLENIPVRMCADLRGLIYSRLKHEFTFSAWLNKYHHNLIKDEDMDSPHGLSKLQTTRHAWVDSMIAEFKEKDI